MSDEILDEVNESDEIVGEVCKSSVHLPNGPIHREVGIIIMDGQNRILLQKRSPHKKTYPGIWVTSAGGHVQKGEEPYMAALRELNEELAVELDLAFLCKNFDVEMNERHMIYWYLAKYSDEKLSLEEREIEQVKFFDKNELDEVMEIQEISEKLSEIKGSRNGFSLKFYKMAKRLWEGEFDLEIEEQLGHREGEILHYVNSNDVLIGKISRDIADSKPKYTHRQIAVVIVDEQKRILWQKRANTKSLSPSSWVMSATGHVAYGSSYIESAHRELLEETGFDTELIEVNKTLIRKDNEIHFAKLYFGFYQGQNLVANETEVQELRFFSIEEIRKMKDNSEKIGEGSFRIAYEFADGIYDEYLFPKAKN